MAVSGWSVTVDYKPRRVDLGALRTGDLVEVRLETIVELYHNIDTTS